MGFETYTPEQDMFISEQPSSPDDVLPEENIVDDTKKAEKIDEEVLPVEKKQPVREFSKNYHHPGYRTGVAEEIIEARKSGKDGEAVRDEFYKKTSEEKELFESQEKERSISEIMKEKDIIFVHGMKIFQWEGRGSDYNNQTLDNMNKELGFEETYKIIAGLEPTISVSTASTDRVDNGLMKKWGIILSEGKILSAKGQDSRSEAFGINKRIPKSGNEDHRHSAIQPEIDIDKVVPRASEFNEGGRWNELVVENPEIAGMYYDMTINTIDPNEKVSKLRERYGYRFVDQDSEDFYSLRDFWKKSLEDERNRKLEEIMNSNLSSEEQRRLETNINMEYGNKEKEEKKRMMANLIENVSEEVLRWKAEKMRNEEIKEQTDIFMKMKEYSEKADIPLYVLKNENDELKKYRVDFETNPEYTEDYLRNVLVPKLNEIRDRTKNINSPEYQENLKEYQRVMRIVEGVEYTLNPVSAAEILESKRKIPAGERIEMINEVKNKGIFSDKVGKEVEEKLANLEKENN